MLVVTQHYPNYMCFYFKVLLCTVVYSLWISTYIGFVHCHILVVTEQMHSLQFIGYYLLFAGILTSRTDRCPHSVPRTSNATQK